MVLPIAAMPMLPMPIPPPRAAMFIPMLLMCIMLLKSPAKGGKLDVIPGSGRVPAAAAAAMPSSPGMPNGPMPRPMGMLPMWGTWGMPASIGCGRAARMDDSKLHRDSKLSGLSFGPRCCILVEPACTNFSASARQS